ncbi:Oidioi.mRNA.OKI2018_I69.chr1.g882.t1.cds [Oikopleura dioica]|uniref:Oidioi.mRNA.OKI2018_I69.chr1.g882.t1.cds n=1 Tax=Oikopleura dioica TaxID=34765 RepID=A0ABN7SLA9_OIKDI|nr:Oidioi.mRNA.OKI2018_I69.chr1.g882.t1.cds [Oikopleura dioica]
MPKKKNKKRVLEEEPKLTHDQYRQKIADREAILLELRNTLEQEELTIKDAKSKLKEVLEQREEIETLLTNQIIKKEDFIDSAVDTHEEIEEKREGEENKLNQRQEDENKDQGIELGGMKQETMRLKQSRNHIYPLALERKKLQTAIFDQQKLLKDNTILFRDTLYDTDKNKLIGFHAKKAELGNKIGDLVVKFRKVSKLQLERTNQVVVRENAVLSKKLLKIDPKARVSLTKAMSLKNQFQEYQCLARTYQDMRLPKTETVVDGTIQMLSKENSEKRRIIQGLVNKYRSLEDELDEQQSEKECDLDTIHRIRELERALTAHRVQTTRLKSTIQQSEEDIKLAIQIKQKLKNASTNFKSVCKMLIEDAKLAEPRIRKRLR